MRPANRCGISGRILNISLDIRWYGGVLLAQATPRPSGWITRDYTEDGSQIDIKTKDVDFAFVYLVFLMCAIIAAGGLTYDINKGTVQPWRTGAVWSGAGIFMGIVLFLLFRSMQVRRIRIDQRGAIYTIGSRLKMKIPWKEVRSVRAYEREGGFTMSETIRGIEISPMTPPSKFADIFGVGSNSLKIESNLFGQESLEKSIRVILFYKKKYDFKANVESWETTSKPLFSR